MQFSATQIASFIDASIEGNEHVTIGSFNNIESAKEGDLSFMGNPKYEDSLYSSKASIIIVNTSLVLKTPIKATLLRVKDAYAAFATLLKVYQEMRMQRLDGIEENAYISASAQLGEKVYVGAFTYVNNNASIGNNSKIYPGCFIGENVKIGENTILYAGAKIYHECVIGSNVIIHAGAVIGADGFGFIPQADGSYQKVPQIGNVIIENDVEIGANTTIDRATLNSTIIKQGVKIDNLVQIAHNVEVGQDTGIAAQAGISGSAKLGKNIMVAGQVGIAGHISMADQTIITAQSGVSKTIKETKQIVSGSPAFNFRTSKRSEAIYRRLPELEKKLALLEKKIEELDQ